LGRLPTCCAHFVKVSLDSLANSVVLAFTVGYHTDVGGVNSQRSSHAGKKPSLCYIGVQRHLPRHEAISPRPVPISVSSAGALFLWLDLL
jgi:hypothetical protein